MEKAAALLDAQHKCTRLAQSILGDHTARAYCSPRFGPFDHVHVMLNADGADMDRDPVAYYDSEDEEECFGVIPNTGLLVAALQREIPGAGVSIIVCA